MKNTNTFDFNQIQQGNLNGLKIKKIDNDTYQFEEKATEGEIIIWSVVGAVVICALSPSYVPYVVFGGGLLASLYGIASIIEKK